MILNSQWDSLILSWHKFTLKSIFLDRVEAGRVDNSISILNEMQKFRMGVSPASLHPSSLFLHHSNKLFKLSDLRSLRLRLKIKSVVLVFPQSKDFNNLFECTCSSIQSVENEQLLIFGHIGIISLIKFDVFLRHKNLT